MPKICPNVSNMLPLKDAQGNKTSSINKGLGEQGRKGLNSECQK